MEGLCSLGINLRVIIKPLIIIILLFACVRENIIEKKYKKRDDLILCMEINADFYDLELALVRAIARVESNGKYNNAKSRYEHHLREAKWYLRILTKEEKRYDINFSSLGAMQILFGTAKTLGHDGTAEELRDMVLNFFYGCHHLKNCITRYTNIEDAISSYNQGKPRKNKKGQYKNQAYVDDVMKWYHYFGGLR